MNKITSALLLGAAILITGSEHLGAANINYSITYDDPGNTYSSYYSQIDSNLQAAGADWASNLIAGAGNMGSATDIEIVVRFTNAPTANAGSATTAYVGNDGTYNLFEQGMAYELNTGNDPNGSSYDFELNIGTAYLQNQLWFDPSPTLRTAVIPSNKVDAYSVLLHELAHGWAFNGFRNQTTGGLPNSGLDASTFDAMTVFDPLAPNDQKFTFVGSTTQALYGGPMPLTYNNIYHFGNNPGAGQALNDELMFGPYYDFQKRYYITDLTRAVLTDVGINVIPEPGVAAYAGLAIGLWSICRVYRKRGSKIATSFRVCYANLLPRLCNVWKVSAIQ
jgi:hypothetical protein